jgi:hypothetical protein
MRAKTDCRQAAERIQEVLLADLPRLTVDAN